MSDLIEAGNGLVDALASGNTGVAEKAVAAWDAAVAAQDEAPEAEPDFPVVEPDASAEVDEVQPS